MHYKMWNLFPVRFILALLLATAAIAFSNDALGQNATPDTSQVRFLNNRKFYIYKVVKGETLYSIAQRYSIPQDEIEDLNPELRQGLKPGMKLWIPAYSWKNKDKSSAASSAVESEEVKAAPANGLHIALISALDLKKVYIGDADVTDSLPEMMDKTTRSNLEFVEGAMLAIENFHAEHPGFKIRTSIVDSEGDSAVLSKMSWKADFRKADVWITNDNGSSLSYLNRLAQKSGAVLISCGVNTAEKIENNKDAIAMLPASLLQCQQMGLFASGHFNNAIGIFVKTSIPREVERMNAFKEGWKSGNEKQPARIADYSKGFSKAVLDSIRGNRHHVIFVPSSNEDMVTTLLNALKEKKESHTISVVGIPKWLDFETVDPALLQQCDVYVFNSGTIPYDNPEGTEFRKQFRDEHATDPGESAYIGNDAAKMILEGWKKNGAAFINKSSLTYDGLFTAYKFKRGEKDASWENQHIDVWNFKELSPERVK